MINEKEIFERITQKQMKYSKKTFRLIFGIIGGLFAVAGIVMLALGMPEGEDFNPGLIFLPMGAFYLLLGTILSLTLPRSLSYERYKKRIERSGTIDYYQMYVMLQLQEEKIKELEERTANLEDAKEELEERMRRNHI